MRYKNETTINQIAELKYGKSLPERERKEGNVPVYGSGGITGYHNQSLIKKGIIVGRKGTVGSVRFSEVPFFPIDTVFYVDTVKGKNDLKFFYYFLQSIGLENYDSDAAVPGLNRNLVHKLSAIIPEPKTQQRIASILSAYDDLIEVNNQRIKLLEQTARELYKEWFVRMRFPGYKQAKFKKGVPEGWTTIAISDVVDFKMGQSPKSEFYNEEGIGLPFHQGVGNYGLRFPVHKVFCSVNGRTANEGDVLFSV
ncbi:MAG: restriction endonuclease subunit S, partial [Bacteroidia bacterium]|nr:restriction endonuclease subunit S [Bacteroidia bacterium]